MEAGDSSTKRCVVISAAGGYGGKQGFNYLPGISAETAGSEQLCMQHVTVPPGARARVHFHQAEEAAYVIDGSVEMYFGDHLQERVTAGPGDFIYVPAGLPHCPRNLSTTDPATGITARVTPREQEDTVLLPELDALLERRLATPG